MFVENEAKDYVRIHNWVCFLSWNILTWQYVGYLFLIYLEKFDIQEAVGDFGQKFSNFACCSLDVFD